MGDIEFTAEAQRRLKAAASLEGCTVSELIERLLDEHESRSGVRTPASGASAATAPSAAIVDITGTDEAPDLPDDPTLTPLTVDLGSVLDLSHSDPSEGMTVLLDPQTGELYPYLSDYPDATFGDGLDPEVEERLIDVSFDDGRDSYRDMEAFIEGLSDEVLAEKLAIAIQGKGAFRRFRDTAARHDVLKPFNEFAEARGKRRLRAWFADLGYAVTDTSEAAGEPTGGPQSGPANESQAVPGATGA